METVFSAQLIKRLGIKSRLWSDLTLISLGVSLLSILAQVKFFLPFTPVPITGQTFAVLLIASLIGIRRGFLSVATYLLIGILGLPVFVNAGSGFSHLFGPTGGYLIGFLFSAVLVGWFSEKGWLKHFIRRVLVFTIGALAIYMVGLPILAIFVGWNKVLTLGLIPFMIGDLVKIISVSLLYPSIENLFTKN